MRAWIPVLALAVGCETIKFDPIVEDTDVEDTDNPIINPIDTDRPDTVDTLGDTDTDAPVDTTDTTPVDTTDTTDTSPPATGPSTVRIGDLLVTEVMFDPSACGQTEGEYVEITWLGAAAIDLGGLEIHDSTSATVLPAGTTVQPGARYVVGHPGLQACYGVPSGFTLLALLSNGGEDIWIQDENGRELDRLDGNLFSVLDGTAWERDDVDPDLWCYADTILNGTDDLGTPGQPNGLCGAPVDTDTVDTDTVDTTVDTTDTTPATAVDAIVEGELLITELMFDPGDCRESEGEYVEITWYGVDPIDLAGLGVHDSTAVTTLPSPTVVQPGGRLIIGRAPMGTCYGAPSDVTTTLSMSNSGEDIWLTDTTGRILDLVDGNELAVAPGRAWERDDVDFTLWCFGDTDIGATLDRGSPGQPNGLCDAVLDTAVDTDLPPAPGLGAGDLLITEFMANPNQCADDVAEYFEILNPGTAAIDLTDVEISDDGNDWLIPSGTVIQPGETLALLRDPLTAPGCYGVTGLLYDAVIGLGQNGDRLRLTAPSGNLIDLVDFANWTVTAGVAWQRDPVDDTLWCLATAPIPGGTDLGSPGVANAACPP
jgi:hypothetical protein